jgi:hypothetical protein
VVVPYQIWMLQRVGEAIAACTATDDGRLAIEGLLGNFDRGPELLQLETLLAGCRVRKERALLFSA